MGVGDEILNVAQLDIHHRASELVEQRGRAGTQREGGGGRGGRLRVIEEVGKVVEPGAGLVRTEGVREQIEQEGQNKSGKA